MATKFDSRQTEHRSALPMVGSAANDTLNDTLPLVDEKIRNLFENRNVTITSTGTVRRAINNLIFSANLVYHFNSNSTGGAPVSGTIASGTYNFTADGNMLYAVLDRVSGGAATVTNDASVLPATADANSEVILLAKRVGSTIYLFNGQSLKPGNEFELGNIGSVIDTDFKIIDTTFTDSSIEFNVNGDPSTVMTIQSQQSDDRTLTLPDITDTLVSRTNDESLTNKRISYSVEDINTSGSEVTITQTKGALYLRNSGLVSIAGINSASVESGRSLVLVNKTGNPVNILNGSGVASTGDAIFTGTGG